MGNSFIRIYEFFYGSSRRLIMLITALVALSLFLISRMQFEEDISKIMPKDEGLDEINALFDDTDFTDRLVILVSHDKDDPAPLIEYCDEFVKRARQQFDSSQVADITYYIDPNTFQDVYDLLIDNLPIFLEEADYLRIENQLHPDTVQQFINGIYKSFLTPGSAFIKKYVFADPLGFVYPILQRLEAFQLDENFTLHDGYIITKDHNNLLFFIRPSESGKETKRNAELISGLDDLVVNLEQAYPTLNVSYFGGVAVAVENARQVRRDVTKTVSIALIALLSLIAYFFRRISTFFLLVIPTALSGLIALAILSLVRGEVSIIAIGIGSVLLGITLDYALHIFTHHRKSGHVRQGIKDLSTPIIISSLTTAIAFLCLLLVRSDALRDLGLFAAMSVIIAAVLALIILPHLLGGKQQSIRDNTFIDQIAAWSIKRSSPVILAIFLLTVFAAFFFHRVQFENDLYAINFMSEDLRTAENKLNEVTNATKRGVYLMSQDRDLDLALEKASRLVPLLDSLKNIGAISEFTSVNQFIPTRAEQMQRLIRWRQFWSEGRTSELRQSLCEAALEFGFRSNAFTPFDSTINRSYTPLMAADLNPLLTVLFSEYIKAGNDQTSILSVVRVDPDQTTNVYQAFENNNETFILDKAFLISRFVDILRADFGKLVMWSLFLVFMLLHISYGRIELAVVTFLPIAISWVWTLALMYWFNLKLNIVNVIITSFIFGLGIDYCIFVSRGLLQAYKHGVDRLNTYKTSILLSVATTLVGIGVMIFAKHPALKSIASISIIGISSVVLMAFVLQPILFRWLIQRSDGTKRIYPLTITNILKTLFIYAVLVFGALTITLLSLFIFILLFIPFELRKRTIHWLIYKFGRLYTFLAFFPNRTFINFHRENFSKPAVIISNHQSHIDTPILFSLTPNLILLTKSWVYKFPLYHIICRLADFYNVSQGIEAVLPRIKKQYEAGYHVALFPEGSRSADDTVRRFHKGAFLIAEALGADILPIYIHGTHRYLPKGSFWGQSNDVTITVGRRITHQELKAHGDLRAQTKFVSSLFKNSYTAVRSEAETPRYFRRRLLENYLYKGTVLRYYMQVKIRLEKYYKQFDQIIPKKATIVDLGCGYGFMSFMLGFLSEDRTIIGMDYDEDKIKTAQNNLANNEQFSFISGDIRTLPFPQADVFILADVLHYLPSADQFALLNRVLEHVLPSGMIIIRDGDKDITDRHKKTKWTELFSTGSGFNKTTNALHFISSKQLKEWAKANKLGVELHEQSTRTSNVVYSFHKPL